MAKNLLDGKPKVQLSLDLQTMADALPTAEIAVKAGVDWLEVGTPLILGEGLHAVASSTRSTRTIRIIADLKTMDAGYLEAEMMYRGARVRSS
jgi:3-hexulose-6-phosphate synthase/6-phospho-3-hexuloisomerase